VEDVVFFAVYSLLGEEPALFRDMRLLPFDYELDEQNGIYGRPFKQILFDPSNGLDSSGMLYTDSSRQGWRVVEETVAEIQFRECRFVTHPGSPGRAISGQLRLPAQVDYRVKPTNPPQARTTGYRRLYETSTDRPRIGID
jgi:hypothetical protein